MDIVLPAVAPGDPLRISASTFVAWKKCPESANSRLQGKYGPDSVPAFLGGLAHGVFRRHLTDGPISETDFVQVCRQEIGDSNLNLKMSGLGLKPSTLSPIIEEVRALYNRFVRFPTEGFEGAEVSLHHKSDDGVELIGTVDAVYREDLGGHRLVDWKTGEMDDAPDQLAFYSLLWVLEKKALPAKAEAFSVKTGESYQLTPTESAVVATADEVAAMIRELRAAWSAGDGTERRAGPWCRYCPILEDCPEGSAATDLLRA